MVDEFIVSSGQASKDQVKVVEHQLGIKFPTSFVEFVIARNGAKLTNAEVSSAIGKSKIGPFGLRNFLEVDIIPKKSIGLDESKLIPFAEDSSGNFFVFNRVEMESVHFWDHETDETVQLAKCFDGFLALVARVDYAALPEPKNASGWIDADFLASLKKDS